MSSAPRCPPSFPGGNLRGQLDALDAQSADRDAYLTFAGDLEGFLAQQ